MKNELEYENTFYTPKLSSDANLAVRRLSWYLKKPMTKTIEAVLRILPYLFDAEKVCKSCKIKDKCEYCFFHYPELPLDEQFEHLQSL